MSAEKPNLVKCITCGAVFEDNVDICPVCKAGRDKFIPHIEEEAVFKYDTEETFLVLGNGIAGVEAAKAIRERNETCKIIMLSEEEVAGYNRPMLTKMLSSLSTADKIQIQKKEWYEERKIELLLGKKITSINPTDKKVLLESGESFTYDKCIYALGSYSFIPPIKGSDKAEVVTIRTIEDVQKVRDLMPKVKNTVVIGGGVLGLEAAWEMSKVSKVTVLEIADKLMVRQLDDEGGRFLENIIKNKGIDFQLNAHIEEITGEASVTGVKLESGENYPADLVIVSSGVRGNTALAQQAGIEINRAVVVNEKMETNIKDIYACGDCAEYDGINFSIWPEAIAMGKVAGANAAGDDKVTYETVTAVLTFNGMDTSLFAGGDNGKQENVEYKSKGSTDENNYEKYYYVDNKLVGAILIGNTSKMMKLIKEMGK